MVDPQNEMQGTTHTYMARVWYRDMATWFNIVSFLVIILQESSVVSVVPEKYHPLMLALVTILNLWIRFQSSTRPVAFQQGQAREVQSIAPAPPKGTP